MTNYNDFRRKVLLFKTLILVGMKLCKNLLFSFLVKDIVSQGMNSSHLKYDCHFQQGSHMECSSPRLLSVCEMFELVKWFLCKFCVYLRVSFKILKVRYFKLLHSAH